MKYTTQLSTEQADYITETVRRIAGSEPEAWPAGTADSVTVALTEPQVRALEGLDEHADGHVDDGSIWIGGVDFPLDVVHNA